MGPVLSDETLPGAASLSDIYGQFTRVDAPAAATAENAWIGEIQPFRSDDAARSFLHEIEEGRPAWVAAGRIREAPISGCHWADPLLVGMNLWCKVLVLILPKPAHTRAYLLRPSFPEYYSVVHPHPRYDQQITWEGRRTPGLCVYSPQEFVYRPDRDRISQFLDQLTLYVARHLVWLRTRQLVRGVPPLGGDVLRVLMPGERPVTDAPRLVRVELGRQVYEYWRGYWPGPTSRASSPATHLALLSPEGECWCGSGVAYEQCHRKADKSAAGR